MIVCVDMRRIVQPELIYSEQKPEAVIASLAKLFQCLVL